MKGIGYLFPCLSSTQNECFQRKLFGRIATNQLETVKEIRKGSLLFLYNRTSKTLMGPFIASSDGGLDIEDEAWIDSVPNGYPAQVRVEWKELHGVKDAAEKFPFLADPQLCKLSPEQTQTLLEATEKAPTFTPEVKSRLLPYPKTVKKFAKLLDDRKIAYLRISQARVDFSQVLEGMKAEIPDFLVISEKLYLVKARRLPFRYYKEEVNIDLEEIEKLKQLELATGITVLVAFPIDANALEWRAMHPFWVWARGERKRTERGETLTIPVKELQKEKLPFL